MKKFFIAAVTLLCAVSAQAAKAGPFLVADVDANADTCLYTAPASTTAVPSPVVVDNVRGVTANNFRICKVDLSGVPVGSDTVSLAVQSTLWGVTSASAPFTFVRPSVPAVPAGSRIVQ